MSETLVMAPATLKAGVWEADKQHTRLGFAVRHMGVSTVRGEFREFELSARVDDEGVITAQAIIEVSSVDTREAKRDAHLRSPDFFNEAEWPELRFVSRDIKQVSDEEWIVNGELEIHGVTRPIALTAEFGGVDHGPEGELRAGFEITGELSRKDYGMRFNAALGSGNAVVADKVKLNLDVELIHQ